MKRTSADGSSLQKTPGNMVRLGSLCVLAMVLGVTAHAHTAQAKIYFQFDAENGTCGKTLPTPPIYTQNADRVGHYGCGPTPNGSKFLEWTAGQWHDHYTEVGEKDISIKVEMGKTYYLAYYFNFTRINGKDIWHSTGQSADKEVEIRGDGIRWITSIGHWSGLAPNKDGYYTMWMGNPTYHLSKPLEKGDSMQANQPGYTAETPIQLAYDQWHSAVMAIKMATDTTGSATLYVDGHKITEYTGIKTAATKDAEIGRIQLGGTIAQPAYDAPPHYRRYDDLLLTDSWQDVLAGGFMKKPSVGSGGGSSSHSNTGATATSTASTTPHGSGTSSGSSSSSGTHSGDPPSGGGSSSGAGSGSTNTGNTAATNSGTSTSGSGNTGATNSTGSGGSSAGAGATDPPGTGSGSGGSSNTATPSTSGGGGGGAFVPVMATTQSILSGAGVAPAAATTTPTTAVSPPAQIVAAPPAPASTYSFPRSLKRGMSGEDVRTLQQFLNTQDVPIVAEGPGSPGNETDYFGPRTEAALARFQEQNAAAILTPLGLTQGTGYFGPSTRAFITQG
ncbi:MAG TPA: peptidoglycan-binding protein [Candidatus Paceibacterota bacterium]